ncbi:MAG: right-handed parallel beta-helix repeat-containing protein, partial [Candidatus Thorarchaeota archaeon]
MKHAKAILVIFTFLFVFGTMKIAGNNAMVVHEGVRNVELNESVILSYESHGVISIINDTDFEIQAANEMWAGDGSSDTPFIIEGYNITNDASLSIEIKDVSLYFEIRDCLITSATHLNVGGVDLVNVTHGLLENCIISYKNTGLDIDFCDNLQVINCIMDNNAGAATVDASNHTTFTGCYFTNTTTGSGFYQDSSLWTTVSNCKIMHNGDYGVEIYGSDYATFTDSEASYNRYQGFYGENSDYGVYERNIVKANGDEGIYQFNSEYLTVAENTIYDNNRYGIYISSVNHVNVSYNTIYNNTFDGINLDDGSFGLIESNDVFNNGWTNFGSGSTASGIIVEYFDECIVSDNQVHNNSQHGIELSTVSSSSVEDNDVWGNYGVEGECGIYLYDLDFCNITSNTVYNNTDNGIYLDYTRDCIISHNIVYDNTNDGLVLDDSNRTLIYYNDFGWN